MTPRTRLSAAVALVVAAVLATPALAAQPMDPNSSGEPSVQGQQRAPTPTDAVEETGDEDAGLAFTLGATYTTSYFFRGYNQEDIGWIVQPYATAAFDVVDSDDVDVAVGAGIWNSVHEEKTGADGGGGPDGWYESDIFVFGDVVTGPVKVRGIYTLYTYPNGAFESIGELGATVGLNDAFLWAKEGEEASFTLSPTVGVFFEIDDDNGTEDVYLELGVTPSFNVTVPEDVPVLGGVSFGFPIVLGFSLDDYYVDEDGDNEFFGYVQVGAKATIALDNIPERYGAWNVIGGVNYLYLDADSLQAANDGGEDYELQGYASLEITF